MGSAAFGDGMDDKRVKISDDDILRIFALSPDPVLSAPEISSELPVTNAAVNKRLKQLEEDEIITSKDVGSAARVYWLTDKGRSKLADIDR